MEPARISADLEPNPGIQYQWQIVPVIIGLLALVIPTYWYLLNNVWTASNYAHGPLVFICILAAIWQQRSEISKAKVSRNVLPGYLVFGIGLLVYFFGRTQDVLMLEVGSQIPILTGLLMILTSWESTKSLWFPLCFLVFVIPLPGIMINELTLTLKFHVSSAVDQILFFFGYPIAKSGVVLTIGPYKILIAEACSGLKSMYSLSALGLFFVYLRGRADLRQNVLLLASILPIAYFANIGRVLALILVTYYLGDAAGRGFLHIFAGLTEFVLALVIMLSFDNFLAKFFVKEAT